MGFLLREILSLFRVTSSAFLLEREESILGVSLSFSDDHLLKVGAFYVIPRLVRKKDFE